MKRLRSLSRAYACFVASALGCVSAQIPETPPEYNEPATTPAPRPTPAQPTTPTATYELTEPDQASTPRADSPRCHEVARCQADCRYRWGRPPPGKDLSYELELEDCEYECLPVMDVRCTVATSRCSCEEIERPTAADIADRVRAREAAAAKRRRESPPARSCRRYCKTGKPCGDSCISASKTCHRGPGCAC